MRRRRRRKRGGWGKGGAEEDEGEEEDDDMVVVAEGFIPTWNRDFLLGRRENDGGEESRCCNTIFSTGTHITAAAVEVLRLIHNKRGGGDDDLHMISGIWPPDQT